MTGKGRERGGDGRSEKELQFHVLGYEEFSLVQVRSGSLSTLGRSFQVSERGGGENWCEVLSQPPPAVMWPASMVRFEQRGQETPWDTLMRIRRLSAKRTGADGAFNDGK